MNKTISYIAAFSLALTTLIFFVCLGLSLTQTSTIYSTTSFSACIVLSWAYVITVIGSNLLSPKEHAVAAEAGKLFAVIYSIYVTIVYFTQLTAIQYGLVPQELIPLFDYQAVGGWLFRINLIGYGIMALSTFFVGLTIHPTTAWDKLLKILLLAHGGFFIIVILALSPMFSGDHDPSSSGIIALMGWCVMFFPIALLFLRRFRHI